MSKKQEIVLHLGFWFLFLGMHLYFNWVSREYELNLYNILHNISFSSLEICIFYCNYCWICPQTIPSKKWVLLIIAQFGLILLFPFLRHIIEEIVIFHITGRHNYHESLLLTPYYVYDNSYFAIRIILFSLVFYFVKNIWNNNKKMNELLLQKKQAEIQNLKNQLSPHFLFNTLNSFYADLMETHPQLAAGMLKLSDMLRYVTYENDEDFVKVQDEIQFIQHYIDLFAHRFDNQVAIEFKIEEIDPASKIPPLLLIHFVENALKHGVSTDFTKPVLISIKASNQQLIFTVENYFNDSEHYESTGIGYKNIRQRLTYLYPNNHNLLVNKTVDFYHIHLQIPYST